MSFLGADGVMTKWTQMRSGDWKLEVAGERWAVAFVWLTHARLYASAANGCQTNYCHDLKDATNCAWQQWSERRR